MGNETRTMIKANEEKLRPFELKENFWIPSRQNRKPVSYKKEYRNTILQS